MSGGAGVEDLLRELAPQVLGALVRRYGHFDSCEDAVQEALLAASVQWPERGFPESPRGWLVSVASRRLTDLLRSDGARRRREDATAVRAPADALVVPAPDDVGDPEQDDTLLLLFLCCHPELSPTSQIALTLRAVGGLTTAEIARAFLVPEPTMAQRISRAKQRIRETGSELAMPPRPELAARLQVVLHVLYLVFNEGYTTSSGPALRARRSDRRGDPVDPRRAPPASRRRRGRRPARAHAPDGGSAPGPHGARRRARGPRRAGPDALGRCARRRGPRADHRHARRTRLGPYQLQAAIAAVHDEATDAADTDWPQVLALYELLERAAPNPMVTLNRAVAVAMVHGPRRGLELLETLGADDRMTGHHRLYAVRAHLLELTGDLDAARTGYRDAARRTTSIPEQRWLEARAASLAAGEGNVVTEGVWRGP